MEPSMLHSLAPYQEYILQGSVLEKDRDMLLHRLNGLCDTVGTGPEKFHDHEMVYVLHGQSATPIQPVKFRVRRALDHQDAPWHLRYVGQPDADSKKKTLVRSCIDVGCSSNVEQFVSEMGFKLEHEFLDRGYLFRKGRMRITVSKIFKMASRGNKEGVVGMTDSYLVELSVAASHGQDQIQDEVKNFGEQLKPLVQLEKLDKIVMDSTLSSVS